MELTVTVNLNYSEEDVSTQIINAAAQEVVTSIKSDMCQSVIRAVQVRIENEISAIVNSAMDGTFQPVSEWGEPKGKPVSVRDMIAQKSAGFMEEKVDSDGKLTNSYTAQTRLSWAVGRVVRETLNHQTKQAIEKQIAEAREGINAEVGKMIAAAVAGGAKK